MGSVKLYIYSLPICFIYSSVNRGCVIFILVGLFFKKKKEKKIYL